MPQKRRATSPVRPPPKKKHRESSDASSTNETKPIIKTEDDDPRYHPHRTAETLGIINRTFYPREISAERCAEYNAGTRQRPIELLRGTLADTKAAREKVAAGDCVVHWFKRDLRLRDNRALNVASQRAVKAKVPLVCVFVVSPQDYEAHGTSAARVDFELRTLEVMKGDLAQLGIPLVVETVEERRKVVSWLLGKCGEWGAKHVYCNMEYEVDELRREARLVVAGLKKNIAVEVLDDDVVVPPGELKSGGGKQYSVYSPWFKAWLKHVHDHDKLLHEYEMPATNSKDAKSKLKHLFDHKIPETPKNKSLSAEEKNRFEHIWPAGEHAAHERLDRFLKEKATKYKDTRNFPAANSTSTISVHLSTGTLAARTAVRQTRDANSARKLDGGNIGFAGYISELAWRDFYKHVLCHWPYVCMSKPFKYEYADIEWESNEDHFKAWCQGRTGYPIVDAAMRQLAHTGYMHNRCRMIVASFLAKHLLLDWRLGEKFFMESLIDGDFASNNGGWGFSASTGVDPQPYFRIFNPLLQSEKFDGEGEYIRKWVPELAGIEGKAIHDPWARGKAKEAEKTGYAKPIVEHKFARERALDRYKSGLGRSTANVGGGVHN